MMQDEFDVREEKLSINTLSTVLLNSPESDSVPDDSQYFPSWNAAMPEVMDKFFPILESTGIFEKTAIKKFHTLLIFVESSEPNHETRHTFGKDKIHSFSKTFHWSEFPLQDKSKLVNFCLSVMSEGLIGLCKKKQLDSEKAEKLLFEIQDHSQIESKEIQIEENEIEEIQVWIKLRSEFPDPDEFLKNDEILECIEDQLEKNETGYVDGSEIGAGYEIIFCCGPSASAMKEILISIPILREQKGNFLQFEDGKKEELL